MKLETEVVTVPLATPFATSGGTLHERPLVLVAITDAEGVVGHGEAAPLEPYVNGTIEECVAALADCSGLLAAAEPSDTLRAACADAAVLAPAVAAIDLALWDLEAKRAGVPVWRLLGGSAEPRPVDVNATIAAPDRAGAAAAASKARAEGFGCIKVKVGLGDDAGRLAAIRAAAGPSMAIRIDANGAWSVDEALASLRALEPVGIELCEEPVHGLDELAAVSARAPVGVALDESAVLPGALDRRVAEAVVLKIAAHGGITGVVEAARRARGGGYDVYLASTLDGPLGIAAALHAATVIRPDRPSGLVTLRLFDGRPDPLPAVRGRVALPAGAGLGDGLHGWYS